MNDKPKLELPESDQDVIYICDSNESQKKQIDKIRPKWENKQGKHDFQQCDKIVETLNQFHAELPDEQYQEGFAATDCHKCGGKLEPDHTCANFYCPNFTFKMPTKITTITAYTEELPITMHPVFNEPRYDWGVKEAYMEYLYDEDETLWYYERDLDPIGGIYHPEDRSQWKPEYDGKSMADFWDYEKGEFRRGTPLEYMPTMFLSPAYYVEVT